MNKQTIHFGPHRGLAMLELVLALPILLFIMALIINYGAVATWKVRENSVVRLAVWKNRWPRTGATDPRPSYWPTAASMDASDQGAVAAMDNSSVDLPVARGPLPPVTVNSELLDPTQGLWQGSASYKVPYPYLSKWGGYTIAAQTSLIDNKWQYQRMGMGSNWQRRIPILYTLPQAPGSLVNAYEQAVTAITQASFLAQLAPLDKDPDFIYYGSLFGWGGAPDFEPRFQPMCTIDRGLTDKAVQQLIDRIQGKQGRPRIPSVAEVMANAFLGLYQQALAAFQGILNANPPASPQMVGLANSQIPQLQTNISELTNFLQNLQP